MFINRQLRLLFSILVLIYAVIFNTGCKKYLDEKSYKGNVIPSTLKDLQALLDSYNFNNYRLPYGGEVSAGDFYLTDPDLAGQREDLRNMYLWNNENQFQLGSNDWSEVYKVVFKANLVFETLSNIPRTSSNSDEWDDIKGQALFLRAFFYHSAAVIWCPAYSVITAKEDLGLPLRLNTNFNEISIRDNLQNTYDLILNDLIEASKVLPVRTIHVLRPSKSAAFALLSRVYLSMGIYNKSGIYADSTLKMFSTLIDYNTVTPTSASMNPFKLFNEEVIYQAKLTNPAILSNVRAKIDSSLFEMYDDNDLRKTLFFRNNNNGTYGFRGSYDPVGIFAGIASDEVYLTRAECHARNNDLSESLKVLNSIIEMRYKDGFFIPIVASNSEELLNLILNERRKQLLMRGVRWMDIKRLNKEGGKIVLVRNYVQNTFSLQPNDLKYALLIPEDVISISGIQQNAR